MQASEHTFSNDDVTNGHTGSILEEVDASGGSPLLAVCRAGLVRASPQRAAAMVRALLAHGADVNASVPQGYTPLYLAAANGTPEMLRLLVTAGADVNAAAAGGWTPLHYCARCAPVLVVPSNPVVLPMREWSKRQERGHRYAEERQGAAAALELTASLLELGANANAVAEVEMTQPMSGKVSEALPWQAGASGRTPLLLAVAHAGPAVVAALVAGGATMEGLNRQQWTALHYAVKCRTGAQGLDSKVNALSSCSLSSRHQSHCLALACRACCK